MLDFSLAIISIHFSSLVVSPLYWANTISTVRKVILLLRKIFHTIPLRDLWLLSSFLIDFEYGSAYICAHLIQYLSSTKSRNGGILGISTNWDLGLQIFHSSVNQFLLIAHFFGLPHIPILQIALPSVSLLLFSKRLHICRYKKGS